MAQVNHGLETAVNGVKPKVESAVLHRDLHHEFMELASTDGIYLTTTDGRKIIDASGGPAVAAIGWGNKRVVEAVVRQMNIAAYSSTMLYTTRVSEELCRFLVDSTNGHMTRAYIVNSGSSLCSGGSHSTDTRRIGSEAMEAAVKLARQYFLEKVSPEPQRTRFISRRQSFHGITLGALAVGGHEVRRKYFEPLLMPNVSRISPCYAYRGKEAGETDEHYVSRLAQELDDEFQRLGPETVCAFVAEPVVGAVSGLRCGRVLKQYADSPSSQALGCVPAVPGYFQAMQAVCEKYGALLIFDEVMCGMGRTGTLHAWEQEGVAPDLQTIGKCLGGGYLPIAGVLASRRVIDTLSKGTA